MKDWFKNWAENSLQWILKNSIGVIIGVLVLVIALGFGMTRLSIDSDMLHWFAKNSKIASLQYYINETFNVNNPTIIMLETDGIFTPGNLGMIRELCTKIKNVQEVNEVLSITEIDDVRSTEDGVIIDKLFPGEIPQDRKKIDQMKKYVMSLEKYNGTLVSADGKFATIIVKGLPNAKSDKVAKNIKVIVDQYVKQNRPDVKAYYAGVPAIMNSITGIVVGDIGFLVPLVALVILLALFISFRHPYGMFLPLLTVSLATVSSMGIMGYLGMALTPIGIAIPVVMMAIGNAYGIYIISEYHEKCQLLGDKEKAIHSSTRRLTVPILLSALTTVFAGFLSLVMTSGLKAIIDFAIINSIGVTLSFVFSLTFVPALLKVLPMAKKRFREPESEKESKTLHNLAVWIDKNKVTVLLVIMAIAVAGTFFATKITTDSDYMKYFKEGSEPRTVTAKVGEVFQGTGELVLYFKGDVTDPRALKTLTIIEEQARYYAGSKSRANSIVEMVATLNANMTLVKRLPDSQTEINNLWFFIEGNEQVSKMVSRDKSEFISGYLLNFTKSDERTAMLKNIDRLLKDYGKVNFISNRNDRTPSVNLASLMLYNRLTRRDVKVSMDEVSNSVARMVDKTSLAEFDAILKSDVREKAWLEKQARMVRAELLKGGGEVSREDLVYALSPLVWNEIPVPDKNGVRIFRESGMSGIVKLFSDMDKVVVDNQTTSIITAVIAVMILIALMFRSIPTGALSTLTVIFTVIVNFGLMGIARIPMNFITVTVASISIGAGIDYTIQYMARYFHEINVSKLLPSDAFIKTVATVGRAILSNALAVGLGFAVLMFSNIVPLRDFGLQMFVTMFTSSIATITLMPIVLLFFTKYLHPKVAE